MYISIAFPPFPPPSTFPSYGPYDVGVCPTTIPIVPRNIPPFDNRIAGQDDDDEPYSDCDDDDFTDMPSDRITTVVPFVISNDEYSIVDDDEDEDDVPPPSSFPRTCVPPSSYTVLDVADAVILHYWRGVDGMEEEEEAGGGGRGLGLSLSPSK